MQEDRLTISKALSTLDRDVIEFTEILAESQIEHVIVSGYVAILTGRSRSTEDVYIILEDLSEADLDQLGDRLNAEGYWGMAMPLDTLADMVRAGERFRVATRDEMFPSFELWLAANDIEHEALSTAITASIDGSEFVISSIELQIDY